MEPSSSKNLTPVAPQGLTPEMIRDFDFDKCLNIEELYTLTDLLEEKGLYIQGSAHRFSAQDICKIIADVRQARMDGLENTAEEILSRTTNTNGLRSAINRIVQVDSFIGLRRKDKENGNPLSITNLDIMV